VSSVKKHLDENNSNWVVLMLSHSKTDPTISPIIAPNIAASSDL
jgi:hypothetical protein